MLSHASRVLRRHPLASFFVALGLGLATTVSVVRSAFHEELATATDIEAADGRGILGRGWFDSWPESPTTKAHFMVFLAGGIGIHEHGSSYDFSMEVFELERRGRHLDVTFLQDGSKVGVDFTIERCSDLPPFDACLRFQDPFRGPRTYFGFADDDELTRRLPWTKGEIELAKARAAAR